MFYFPEIPCHRFLSRGGLALALPVLLLLQTGCNSESSKSSVTESDKPATTSPDDPRPIRIAMSAAFVSEAGVGVYDDISTYLAGEMGNKVEFVTGFGYETINDMLSSGAVDVGFVCGLPYVLLHDQAKSAVELLAAPVMKDKRYGDVPKYYSDLVVRKDSDIQSINDLKGRTYVFNDKISNSGYNMPRYRLLKLGLTDGFFGEVLRSGSHEESLRMVAAGKADASFVDSLVLEYDKAHGLGVASELRVIESVGPAGIPPVVVSHKVPDAMRRDLQRHLLAMHENPKGRAILDRALVQRFVAPGDSNYDDIRTMKQAADTAGFDTIR